MFYNPVRQVFNAELQFSTLLHSKGFIGELISAENAFLAAAQQNKLIRLLFNFNAFNQLFNVISFPE